MTEQQINSLMDWFYIYGFLTCFAIIAGLMVIIISLVVYLKTCVHVKDWIDDKFK